MVMSASGLIAYYKQGGYGKDTLRPVTIKQILDAQQPHPDADFRIDGEGISQVRSVSHIGKITLLTTWPGDLRWTNSKY